MKPAAPPTLRVVAGVHVKPGATQVLGFRRAPHKALAGMWEFPGGKVEAGETDAHALQRELREELGVNVRVGDELCVSHATAGERTIELVSFLVEFETIPSASTDHDRIEWFDLDAVVLEEWAEPDRPVFDALRALKGI
ncbi:MAG: (deoxy)nucleoside triphosphate pyrophosphohydrolase [Microbacteriaceae bacterium]